MSGWLDFKSNKVKDFTCDLVSVDFSVPDFNVDYQVVSETFQFVKDEVFSIFYDCLFGLDKDNFELG
jgi:hypothetical protein